MTTVSGTNKDEIEDILDLVVENDIDIFAFARYCPTSFDKETHLEPMEYRDLLDRLWKKFEIYKDRETTFSLKDHLWNLYPYEKGLYQISEGLDKNIMYDGCNYANCHMTILPTDGISKVSELVGLVAIPMTSKLLKKHGIICSTGQLGGNTREGFDVIKNLPNGVYLSSFYRNYPSQEVMDDIFKIIEEHHIEPVIGTVLSLNENSVAHEIMEQNKGNGKVIIQVEV